MLSILIPSYNYVCTGLVKALQGQASELGCPYEILVADDASGEPYKRENREINRLPGCKYLELPQNVGRSRIRNFLGRQARYDYLLFIDCDAIVSDSRFLARYMAVCGQAPVVYGGLVHPDAMPSPDVSLAYRYEKRAEPRHTAVKRARHPYASFRTFNFMVARKVFLEHPFDEDIVRYGHEDTLFGKALKEAGVGILHIDNPLVNGGLDTNEKLLDKTEESLRMLYVHRKKLEGSSGVLRLHGMLQRFRLVPLVAFLYRKVRPAVRRDLLGTRPHLLLFAFYKIGFYCDLSREG